MLRNFRFAIGNWLNGDAGCVSRGAKRLRLRGRDLLKMQFFCNICEWIVGCLLAEHD